MIYDGDGNRVARTEGGVTHRFLIDDQTPTGYPQVAEELVPTDGVIRQHTYGVMRIIQRQLLVSPNWQVSYYGYDGGGSVRQLTDPTGVVTDTYAYDAFGNTIVQTGTSLIRAVYPSTPVPWNSITTSAFSVTSAGTYTLRVANSNQPGGGSASVDVQFTVTQ